MKKSHKAIAILVIASTALVFLLFSLNALIEKNRDLIREEIERILGRSLAFDQLRLSIWGGPGLSAKGLRVAEDPHFAATPFIQTKELRMQLSWLPLLLGRIEIKRFVLDEPEIQIIRNETQSLNIAMLPGEQKKPREAKETKRRFAPSFSVSEIVVSKGKVDYIDRSFKEPVEIRVRNVDLALKGLALSGTTVVKIGASLLEAPGQNVKLEGRMGPFETETDWRQYPFDLQLKADSLPLAQLTRALPFLRDKGYPYLGISGPVALRARLLGSFDRPRVSDLSLSGPFFGSTQNNATLKGELDFSRGDSWMDGEIKAKIDVDSVSLNQLKEVPFLDRALPPSLASEGPFTVAGELQGSLRELKVRALIKGDESEIQYGDWLKKPRGTPLQMEVNLRRQQNRLVFDESILTLHNLRLQFSGALDESPERLLMLHLRSQQPTELSGWDRLLLPLSPYSVKGNLHWDLHVKKSLALKDGLDIRGTLDLSEIRAKDKKDGRGIEKIAGRVSFLGKEARVEKASLLVGSSAMALEATVPDLSQPALRYTLRSPKLNLADLTGKAQKTDEMKTLSSTGELQMSKGKTILRGNLSSSEGTLQEIPYRNLRGEIAWSPDSMSFKNLSFQAMNGNVRATGAWEAGADSQRLQLESDIDAVDLKALLSQKFPKFKDHMEGRINLKANLRGESKNGANLQESLQGEGETQVRGGALKDFNLVERVLSKVSGLPGFSNQLSSRLSQRHSNLLQRRDTPFDTLAANFTVKQGRIYTENLLLATPDFNIHAEGWLGLDKTMKWNGTLVMSPQLTQELIQEHKNVRYLTDREGRLAIPFRLEGILPHVQARPDIQALSEMILKGLGQKGSARTGEDDKDSKKKTRRELIQKGMEQLFGKSREK